MALRKFIFVLWMTFMAIAAVGSPARRGPMNLMQPDGTSFTAVFQGDEFIRIKATAEGHAIIQDEDGWWCYAIYCDDGSKISSGWRVGSDAPYAVLAESMNIPYATLSPPAGSRRATGHSLGSDMQPIRSLMSSSPTKSSAIKHGIVILAEFQDIRFLHTKEDFEALLTQDGYDLNGATGSAKEYFDTQFSGLVEFDFEVSDIVTVGGKREYYGANNDSGDDIRPYELIIEACRLADETVDFSLYDDDNDGVVDNVFVFFAGEDEAEGGDENCIWSHAWYIRSGAGRTLQLDGKLIDRYACTSEMTRIYNEAGKLQETRLSGIGTFCHEYCHTFGLPDMYDTNYDSDNGWAAGLWNSTSIMDSGNQNNNGNTPPNFNAIEREILGFADLKVIEGDGAYSMEPIDRHGVCFRMETDKEDEYYLFECRNTDNRWDAYIGGSGMLVYHIDRKEDVASRWTIGNTVNADASHQCADLVEADGRADCFISTQDYLSRKDNIKGIFFPYNEVNSIGTSGRPGLTFWSGEEGVMSITGIRWNEDGGIDFNVIGESEKTTPPSVRNNITHDVFCDGAIITFESSREYDGEATFSYGLTGQDTTTLKVLPYESGKYSVMLDGLSPAKTYTVTISFIIDGIEGKSGSVSFMTKKSPVVSWPYMHFGHLNRNSDGTFPSGSRIPLKLINAQDAAQVKWTFDDKEILPEPDHYYTLEDSGILKALITWEDGTEEIISKEITLPVKTGQ